MKRNRIFSILGLSALLALRLLAATEYMAICTEKSSHGGSELGLTSWLDSMDKANTAGKDHERANKGHRWRLATRERK